jgi:two-component system, response regulator YesN
LSEVIFITKLKQSNIKRVYREDPGVKLMKDEIISREISIVYDLLFGFTNKMKTLREKLDSDEFILPVHIAMVLIINDFNIRNAQESEFRKEEQRRIIYNLINKYADRYFPEFLSAILDKDTIVVFFVVTGKKNEEFKRESIRICQYIKDELESRTEYSFSLGIGRSYKDIKGLIYSYKEAMDACKKGHFMEDKRVIHIDDLLLFNEDIPISISEREARFLEAIRENRINDIGLSLKNIVNAIVNMEMIDPETIKMRIIDLFIKTVNEINNKSNYSLEISNYIEEILKSETKKCLLKICSKVFEKLNSIMEINNGKTNNSWEINKALVYINHNYRKDLSLKEISQEIGLSLYYFSHIFKEEVGESFVTYLNRVRIREAKKLLQETNLNIAEISYKVGYNDPNYFTRVFKEYTSMTPSDYRLVNRNEDKF